MASLGLALALFAWAWISSRQKSSGIALAPDVPEQLVQRGAFACVRHPFYVSYVIGWIGLALVLDSVATTVGAR